MAWQSMASPAIFAVIGDSLPRERRAMGFTLQSILKRIPVVIAPIAGGLLIARLGIVKGVHASLLVTLVFAAATLLLVRKITLTARATGTTNIRSVWRTFHRVLSVYSSLM
jgi:MFS family permease